MNTAQIDADMAAAMLFVLLILVLAIVVGCRK